MEKDEIIKWLRLIQINLGHFPEISNEKKIHALGEAIDYLKSDTANLLEELSSSEIPNKSEIPTDSDDCISRAQALDLLCKKCPVYNCIRKCITYKAIEKMPPSPPIRPKGQWIDHSDEGYVECPRCGSATNCDGNIADLHFCFSCGAEMRGSEE